MDIFEKLFHLSGSAAQQFADILNASSDNIVIHAPGLRVVWANQSAVESFGAEKSDIAEQPCYSLWHKRTEPCTPCPVLKSFKTAESENGQISTPKGIIWELRTIPMKDGKGSVISVIEICKNISEKRNLEEQLWQSHKMEAIGRLTGGIAHDFNNILTAIIGYCSILKMKLQQDSALMQYTDQILASSERAAALVRSLLSFSRKHTVNFEQVDLNELIKNVEKLLSRLIGEDIELETKLEGRNLIVTADSLQFEQILMNLAVNARDAMPDGGLLTIETGLVEFDEEYEKVHGYGKPGMYALISVTDVGCGMDEETSLRIFEPFFTTKEADRGTGLGLSIVYGIIKQHNGYINCYSETGKGTTFKIYMPVSTVNSGIPNIDIPISHVISSKPDMGGTETVLVAEDDGLIRKIVKEVLEEFGYKIIEAVDGEDAIDKFMDNKDRIDVIFLDMIMPKMNGEEAYAVIRKIKPDMKALFASGYPADFIKRKGIGDVSREKFNFVMKPISPNELLKKLKELLNKDRKQ